MLVQKDFLNKLRDFGLNSYESKLWTALLSRGISTAGELSDIANVPRSRSYDVLESLEKKGFIVMKLGKPIKYIAVPPSEVIERVKKKIKVDSDKQSSILDNLKKSEVLEELNLLHTQGIDLVDPTEISGVLKGRNNLYHHLEMMVNNAQKSITIATTSDGFLRKTDALLTQLKKAKDRGVKIKIAAPLSTEHSSSVKHVSKLAQIKHSENLRSRFFIVDGSQVTLMMLDDNDIHPSYDFGIWLNSGFFAGALEHMFNAVWNQMDSPKTK